MVTEAGDLLDNLKDFLKEVKSGNDNGQMVPTSKNNCNRLRKTPEGVNKRRPLFVPVGSNKLLKNATHELSKILP
jgi:hypothetical protein|tara:strand:+ start:360 stop:584 length:225 start_codon:yes stop_codon:yes gene_type:complete